jgi:type IV pilus assembly protein PilN
MIKINLLPIRTSKRKETEIQQVIIVGIVVFLIAVIVSSLYVVKRMQVAATRDDIATAKTRISELKTKIGKLEELKSLKEQVKKKLAVLAQLRKNKTGPAQRLASLSDLTPEQLWITAYAENGRDVRMSGIAFTEELIAQYMKALEASSDFMGVELIVSEQIEVSGTKLKKFDMLMKLESAEKQPPVDPSGKK